MSEALMYTGFVSRLEVDATVNGLFSPPKHQKIQRLYQRALDAHWHPDHDIEWLDAIDFGSSLPCSSQFSYNEFAKSPLSCGRPCLWNAFRWELQAWLVCQFLYGEQAALVTTARLTMCLTHSDEKLMAASQVADEARHVATFGRYVERYLKDPYPLSASLKNLMADTLADSDWDITLLGMQVIIEGLADATFRMGASTFHDPVIRRIVELVATDEARHIAFGVLMLKDIVPHLSHVERVRREDFILSAAEAIRRRFMLEEVWERLEVEKSSGMAFAAQSPLMVGFRRAAFAKVASVLVKIGLMTDRVRGHLQQMQLLH